MPYCSFSNFSNTFLTSLLRFFSKIKIFMAENSFFLFSFSCFILMFPVLFSLLMVLSRRSDSRRQNTSPREMSEANGENGQQSLKRRSFVGVFFSMTESLSWWTWINHGECLGWWFLARFGSNSVFLVIEWLVCDTDSPRDTRKWMLIIISLCFSLSPLLFSSCLPSFLNTWQKVTGNIGQLEAVKLNLEDSMVCVEDQKKIVLEKQKVGERQLNTFEQETNKLADGVTAALVINEEHMSDYHTRLILILHMAWAKNQSNDTKRKNLPNHCARPGCTLAMSWNGNRFTERRWGVGWKEMMKCGIDGRARIKKRTRKEAKWKQRTRRDRSVMSRVGHFAHGPAHVQKKNCRGATDSIHCRVWCHDMFSEFRVFRNIGRWSAKCSTTMEWSMSL